MQSKVHIFPKNYCLNKTFNHNMNNKKNNNDKRKKE